MTTRSFLPRIALVLALCGAALCGTASAQSIPPVPDWYGFKTPIPIEQGEFYIPGGTLGSLSIAIADNGTVGGAVYFYTATGELVAQAIDGALVRNDDDTVRETGEIAYADLDTYALSDGPCRGCPYQGRTQVQTSDVTRIAWVAPRKIELTVNGMTETAVGLVNGPPLVAVTDLTGTWVRVRYQDGLGYPPLFTDPNFPPSHTESIDVVLIAPLEGSPEFTFATGAELPPDYQVPPDPAALPPVGARLYEVICASPDCQLNNVTNVDGGATRQIVWVDSGAEGRAMSVAPTGVGFAVYDYLREVPRLYVTADRIIGRSTYYRGEPRYGFEESYFFRVPSGSLNGDWELSPCPPEGTGPGDPPCNPVP